MFTQCRGCGEIFSVSADDLVIARARVRCNVCGTVFDALETLSEEAPQEDEDLFLHQSESAPPLLTSSLIHQEIEQAPPEFVEAEENDAPLLEPVIAEYPQNEHQEVEPVIEIEPVLNEQQVFLDAPEDFSVDESFIQDVQEKRQSKQHSNVPMWLGLSAAALLLLGWQSIAAIRGGTLPLPGGTFTDSVCEFLSCEQVKKPIDLKAVSLVSRNIRQHPGQDEALIISASMINANPANRDFPAIEIILSNLDGQPMAMRRFLPQEYLPADILKSGFLNDVLIPVSLEVSSPGDQAVAFQIDFVQP